MNKRCATSGDSTKWNWPGVFAAVTTPFSESCEVDFQGAAAHAHRMIEAGCTGLVIGGSLGEGQALSLEEKRELWHRVSAELGQRSTPAPVLASIGAASTREACRLAIDALECGCSGLMILPPYVHCGDLLEALAHIEAVARATPLPSMVYNNPFLYRADLSAESIAHLAHRNPNLKAVKDSTGDARRIAALARLCRNGDAPDLALMVGLDDCVMEGVAAGATGWVAGLVNALPVESVRLWNLAREGVNGNGSSWQRAHQLNDAFLPLLRMDTQPDFVQRIKLVQTLVPCDECDYSTRVRSPRLELDAGAVAACTSTAAAALQEVAESLRT